MAVPARSRFRPLVVGHSECGWNTGTGRGARPETLSSARLLTVLMVSQRRMERMVLLKQSLVAGDGPSNVV
jgi:hypothetical protein